MSKAALSRKQKQTICSKYKKREATQEDLAIHYGVHRKTIWNALFEMGLTNPRTKATKSRVTARSTPKQLSMHV